MFNRIAGVRSSSPAPSSRHLAISSQHLLGQARAHQAMGNLEKAQKSYREAIEKAKIEHEKNPGNSQAKKTFEAISNEFLAFLNELSLSGHQEPGTVAPIGEQTFLSPNRLLPINRNDATTHELRSAQRLQDTFLSNGVHPASLSQQQPVSMPAQAKSELVDYLFTKALSTLGSLEIPDKPSLFLVYAHDNPVHGKAEADTSKYFIDKLSKIQGVKLYSDQAPMGQPYSNSPEELKEDSKLEDILTNQLCLLPDQLIKEVKPVDKVVVCCSEVLGSYLKWSDYKKFHQELRDAYHEDRETYHKDAEQPRTLAIREVVRKFSQVQAYKAGFHHVLTEIAFLQIRAEYKDQHSIIPVSLTENSYAQCLAHFIPATTVRMEDISRFEQKTKVGREVHPNQSRHLVLFKVIERLLVASDEAQTFLNKFWEAYIKFISEPSTPGRLEFVNLVDSIFEEIQAALRGQLARDLPQMRRLHTEIKQKLLTPDLSSIDVREALYKHYQRSNLSIQRVSGQTVSLDGCYINLAIVESQAQCEKDKKELEKQAATFERLPSSEQQQLEATNPNKLIALEKLFEKQKLRDGSEGIPKRILIQGRAGIGKTTLCKKLVYDYQNSTLWQDQFESVLWVPLRQLKIHSPKRLEDLLYTQYFAGYESSQAKALSKVFYAHQDKTLFILDGLDEVVEELNEGRPLTDFLQTLLNQAHVVITSRPAGVDAKLLGQLDLELETIGFNPENVQAYIEAYAAASDQEAIRAFIDRMPLIQGLVNIPIQLDALCYSWDKLPKNQASVTMSMLYEAMVDKLWRKDGTRLEKKDNGQALSPSVIQHSSKVKLEQLMGAEIDYLGYLAFKGLEEGRIEFTLDELGQRQDELEKEYLKIKSSFSFTEDLKRTSFLHTVDAGRPEAERYYHFLHLTFQEFFTAKFLVKHLNAYLKEETQFVSARAVSIDGGLMLNQEKLEAFIAMHKYNPRYEIVWWMVAGLLQKGGVLEKFFTQLAQAPRDLIGMRHQQVMMGCLNEARAQLKATTLAQLENEFMQWLNFELKNWPIYYSRLGSQRVFPEPLLLKSLSQAEGKKKTGAIKTLGARPALSDDAVQALISFLKDENESVRSAAASVLCGRQNALSDNAVQALISFLKDENESVRSAAASVLGHQNTLSESAVQALIQALQDEKLNVRSAAASELEKQKTLSAPAVLALILALEHENLSVRFKAASALEKQKTLSTHAVLALILALHHKNNFVVSVAARVLEEQKTLPEPAVQTLIQTLQDENEEVMFVAVRALGAQKTLSTPILQALIQTLQHKDSNLRQTAAGALGAQKTLSAPAVQALVQVLQDKNGEVRVAAVRALSDQKTLLAPTIQALIQALQDEYEEVRVAAVRALGNQKMLLAPTIQALIQVLQDKNGEVRVAAVRALGDQKTLLAPAVQALIQALQDENEEVKFVAVRALGDQKTLPESAVQTLIQTLPHEGWGFRNEAAGALGAQKALSENAVQGLIQALQHEDRSVRSAVVRALGGQNLLSASAIQALIQALQDEEREVRFAAADALGAQKTLSEPTVLTLIQVLQHKDYSVRSAAVHALNSQNLLPESAVQALIQALQHEDYSVRSAAAGALGTQKTLSESAVLALIEALQHEDHSVRFAVAYALAGQNPLSARAVQALIRALQHENHSVRLAVANMLGAQKTMLASTVLTWIKTLHDEDHSVRSVAVRVLGGQNPLSAPAALALSQAVQDKNKAVRLGAVRALNAQKTSSELIDQALIQALQDEDRSVRSAAAHALGSQETLSESVVQALIQALQDEDHSVRSAAASVLSLRFELVYAMLLELKEDQIQIVYREFLFDHNRIHIAPLYIQENRLHFYTKTGPGKTKPADMEKLNKVIKAFQTVQMEAGITSLIDEARFLIEE